MGLKEIISSLVIATLPLTGCIGTVHSDPMPNSYMVGTNNGNAVGMHNQQKPEPNSGNGFVVVNKKAKEEPKVGYKDKSVGEKEAESSAAVIAAHTKTLPKITYIDSENPNIAIYANKLVDALTASKECKKVYITKMQTQAGEHTIVVCEEKKKRQLVPKYRINLNDICDVSLHEHFGMFEWMRGDDVAVRTKHGSTYTMRLWDKHAKNVYNVLNEYLNTIKTMEGGARCQK
ncbi:hypothetical protein HN695_05970 [Candidatus Woesearchaeota archaeon]|jgi:hypothetical protein|nr:hypothetical protein [Candidatus Woesearchaeota archaeon]MBT5272572.1 hypothetical protein [Candidatus Woesearchaeota archaeon]MBT6040571.1 hypothetical protein [Candidatus Woesearchaeota archaeon]MBT6337124.1 hypothetical protein [Candidatus Woesearchaeota archaeon]MBT7927856.1 hypothetical protein [Candidatus Woesearchaeota archaeon]